LQSDDQVVAATRGALAERQAAQGDLTADEAVQEVAKQGGLREPLRKPAVVASFAVTDVLVAHRGPGRWRRPGRQPQRRREARQQASGGGERGQSGERGDGGDASGSAEGQMTPT